MSSLYNRIENTVGKGGNAGGSKHFVLFPRYFKNAYSSGFGKGSVGYLHLLIITTGCPSERRAQKTVSHCEHRIQGHRTKLLESPPGSLTCIAPSHST